MLLSADGKTLIEVTNEDIHQGQLIIPKGVTTIGQFAFEKCTNLTALTIPEGVIVSPWGHIACPGLTEVSLAKGVWLGRGAFPGRTSLIKVNISEGVYIDRDTFVSCTRLKEVSIAAGTSVGWHAFEGCTALTELSLAEGVQLNCWAFWGCTALTRIIVDTEQDQELTRIKNLFPQHQHAQFIKKSVYDLMCLQDKAYHQLMREPWVSGLFPLYEHLKLIPDILPHINAQEGADHLAYRLFHEEVAQLTFPTDEGALAAYQQQLQDIVQNIKAQIIAQVINVQKAQCIAKLQGYVRTVEGLMQHKLTQHPGFFAAKPALHSQLTEHTAAVGRLIQYVQGDKTVQFSQEAIHRFSQGFVGQTLAQFNVRLDELAEQQALAQFRKAYHSRLRDDQRRCFGSWRRSRLNLDAEGVRLQDIFDHALRNQGHRTRAVLQQLGWLDKQGHILESIREVMTEDKIQQERNPKSP